MVQINDQTHPILGLIYTQKKVNLILRNVISKLFPPHLQLWLAAFQWSMSAKRAEKTAKIPRGQLFRSLSTHVSYTALKRVGGQGNLSPVEMISAMLCEPSGFLSAHWFASHIQAWGKHGHPSFWSPSSQISNTQKRASDLLSPAGYALR